MTTSFVLTFVGRDKPGHVNAISEKVAESGGSWLDSRSAHLAGEFAGIILISIPEAKIDSLTAALRNLEPTGLRFTIQETAAALPKDSAKIIRLDLVGHDRPGIVRDVTRSLIQMEVNIEEFNSNIEAAPFTGEAMFRATALLRVPDGLVVDEMRKTLERLAGEIMVDLEVIGDELRS